MKKTSQTKFRLNYFNKLIFAINLIGLLIGYSIYLNQYISPSITPYFNFIAIVFPIIFVFVLLFYFYWILVSRRYFLIIFILSLGLYYPFYLSYPLFNFNQSKVEKNIDFSVMTFNPHGFKEEGTKELIEANLADIMLFQEARESQQKKWSEDHLGAYHKAYFKLLTIYSKYPIIKSEEVENTDSESGLIAYFDIDLGKDTVRFINAYMEPMQIPKELVKDMIKSENTEEMEVSSKMIENKLVRGMQMHTKQLDILIPIIKNSPHPVIFGADLNSTPLSYEYQQINKILSDSYIQTGEGNATTFHGFKFPIRIDYLFHSDDFEVINSKVIRKKFSDHFPVIVSYKFLN